MVLPLPHNAVVRLIRLNPPEYSSHRLRSHLKIILFHDFRGTVRSSDETYSLIAFTFPRWLDCPVPAFSNYLLSLAYSLIAFIYPGYAARLPFYYVRDGFRYVHDGLMYIWVKNEDLEVVSLQFVDIV